MSEPKNKIEQAIRLLLQAQESFQGMAVKINAAAAQEEPDNKLAAKVAARFAGAAAELAQKLGQVVTELQDHDAQKRKN